MRPESTTGRLLVFNLAHDEDDPILGFTPEWVAAFAARCRRVEVITMRAGRFEDIDNVVVRSVGKERGFTEARRVLRFFDHLDEVLAADDVVGCFAHMNPAFLVLAAPVLRRRHIRSVLWWSSHTVPLALRAANRLANVVVTADEDSYPLRTPRLRVIGHGIDTARFAPRCSERDRGNYVVLVVGRVSPSKRVDVVVRAIALLTARGASVRLRIVGPVYEPSDEAYDRALQDLVRDAGLDVERPGPACRGAMSSVYRDADVVVSVGPTARYDKATLEAMSCGVPTIADPLATPASLAAELERVLRLAPVDRRRVGLAGRMEIEARHQLHGVVGAVLGELL